jgi:acetyl-CoA carboxylase biotin carboxyl carrier protein
MARTEVQADMAGTVKEVLVSPGDTVAPGQELLILESMKMEIPVEAPREGTVGEVLVEVGDVIQEGQALVALEALL